MLLFHVVTIDTERVCSIAVGIHKYLDKCRLCGTQI